MSRRRPSPDPSQRVPSYQQGIAPTPQPQPAVEPPEFDWDPQSKSNIMARRAATFIRGKYGIADGDLGRLAQHDREVKQVWREMMTGKWVAPQSSSTPRMVHPADVRMGGFPNWF